MASFGSELGKLGGNLVRMGKGAWNMPRGSVDAFRNFGKAAEAVEPVVKETGKFGRAMNNVGDVASWVTVKPAVGIFKGSAKAALWVVEQPFAWATKLVSGIVGGVASLFEKAPLPMGIITAIGGVLGITHVVTQGKRREASQTAMMQMAALQGLQSGQQSYMNVTSPQDYVAMQDRAKVNGENAPGFAEAARAGAGQSTDTTASL